MASDSDDTSGAAALMAALNVQRNARVGFVAGLVVTVAIFVFFVVVPGVRRSPLYYVGLGFVLAVGLGGLLTMGLTMVSAYRLSKEL